MSVRHGFAIMILLAAYKKTMDWGSEMSTGLEKYSDKYSALYGEADIRAQHGVAMITVIILTAVLMMMGASMYIVASREGTMSSADYAGSEAFYYAEGGIENTLDVLTYAGTEAQLTQPRPDQSDNGYGYLMDPTPSQRENPTDPVQMTIGKETYTVWVDEVDENGNHCTDCGLNLVNANPAYVLITAEGQSSQGYRMLQQRVRLEASGFPLTLYVDGDAELNGTVSMNNQSLYVRGNFKGREKLDVSGTDLQYGGPAGVFATGSIFAKANGGNSQIYTYPAGDQSSYWDANYVNDRDSRGPTGNTFTLAELQDQFETGGLTTSQLTILKGQAKASGYYRSADGGFNIQQGDLPSRDGNIVVYVEFPSGSPENNEVDLKFTWPNAPYTDGKALVVVKNGSVRMTGNAIGDLQGSVYCPDGPVTIHGGGSGTFTGFVWGKGMVDIGNFPFNMTEEFLADPPFYAWTVVRETAWTEVDR